MTLTIDCPEEIVMALGKRPEDAAKEIRLMAALKLYEAGRISSGMAAHMAGMPRATFVLTCGQYGVSIFQQTPEELKRDTESALYASSR